MKYGVSGDRQLSIAELKVAEKFFDELFSKCGPEDVLYHGDSCAIETIAKRAAARYGVQNAVVTSQTMVWAGNNGLKQRNKRIVYAVGKTGMMICLVSPDSQTGSTLWTYHYAKRQGVPTQLVDLANEPVSGNC